MMTRGLAAYFIPHDFSNDDSYKNQLKRLWHEMYFYNNSIRNVKNNSVTDATFT